MKLIGIPHNEYLSHPSIGHSSIVKAMRSPAHLREALDNPKEPTPAMAFGTAVHTAILEPALFREKYAIVNDALLTGTLATLDDYKAAATELGIKFDALNKDELKVAIRAADKASKFRFKDEVQAEMVALTTEKLAGSLATLDDLKQAAISLGIEIGKMKKDELKTAIKVADTESEFVFREDVQIEMAALTADKLTGTLATLDDYKAAATELGVKFDALNKDELKASIKAADKASKFKFYEDEFARRYADKIIFKPEQADAIIKMRNSVADHKGASRLLSEGVAEKSAFWTDQETGIECKCRPDWLQTRFGEVAGIVDVKTCCNASAEAFGKAIVQFGYDVQAAFYQDGIYAVTGQRVPFYFVAVEKDAPHTVAVYKASALMIEVGRAKYRAGLQLIKWCFDHKSWPGYQPNGEIEEIDLPRWASFDLEE